MGTSILTVLARDADQTGSVNALVEYSLIGGALEYFTSHPGTGVISNKIILVSLTPSHPVYIHALTLTPSHAPPTPTLIPTSHRIVRISQCTV